MDRGVQDAHGGGEVTMRNGKQIRSAARAVLIETEAQPAVAPPPSSGRLTRLEVSRAGLLSLLTGVPAVCRSIGLVR